MSGRDDRIFDDNLERGINGNPPKGGTVLGGAYDDREQQIADDANRRGKEIAAADRLRKESDS